MGNEHLTTQTRTDLGIRQHLNWRYFIPVLFLSIILVAAGISNSHSSLIYGSDDEKATVLLGSPRAERSDEYLRGTPRLVATLNGIKSSAYSPMDVSGDSSFEDQQNAVLAKFVAVTRPLHLVLADQLSAILPLRMGFALQWWLASIALLILLPIWFSQIGLRSWLGMPAALALLFSPVNMWFSNLPVFLFANAVCAAVCGLFALHIACSQNLRAWQAAAFLILATYAGRSAFTVIEYPPWGIPIITLVGITSLLAARQLLFSRKGRKVIGLLMIVCLAAVGASYLHNREIYDIVLQTVYPGQRRTSGGNADTSVWSGPLAWMMQGSRARSLGTTNPEMALGHTFFVIPILLSIAFRRTKHISYPVIVGSIVTVVLVVWSSVQLPTFLQSVNPLVFIPASRASQIAGLTATLTAFLHIAAREREEHVTSFKQICVVPILVVMTIVADVEHMRNIYLQNADIVLTWVSILIAAGLSVFVFLQKHVKMTAFSMLAVALSGTMLVSPVTVGLGALEESDARTELLSLSKDDRDLRWATTGFFQDALMISTGVPQLSGQQPLGPNRSAWRVLDPDEKSIDAWNRGQAYVNFQWDARPGITIWNPSPDVIQVVVDPCRPELDELDLGWVVTGDEIFFYCLEKAASVTWMGAPLNIYRRTPTAIFGDVSN